MDREIREIKTVYFGILRTEDLKSRLEAEFEKVKAAKTLGLLEYYTSEYPDHQTLISRIGLRIDSLLPTEGGGDGPIQ